MGKKGRTYYDRSGGAIRNPGAYFAAVRRNNSGSSSSSSYGGGRSYSSSSRTSYSSYGSSSGTYRSSGISKSRSSRSSGYRTGLSTASGAPIRNAAAYAATGAPCYSTSTGKYIARPAAYAAGTEANIRQSTDTPKYLYHYTSPAGLAAIRDSGVIKASRGPGDCALGAGVYATALPPRTNDAALVANNWGPQKSASTAKVEACVRIDADRLGGYTNGRAELGGRDVFRIPGDVKLDAVDARCTFRK